MTFVVIDNQRDWLESLTRLLLDTFPGSVIYQQTKLLHLSRGIQETDVDAVFLQAEEIDDGEMLRTLRRCWPRSLVCFLVEREDFPCLTVEGDICCLSRPITEQKLKDALFGRNGQAREKTDMYSVNALKAIKRRKQP